MSIQFRQLNLQSYISEVSGNKKATDIIRGFFTWVMFFWCLTKNMLIK